MSHQAPTVSAYALTNHKGDVTFLHVLLGPRIFVDNEETTDPVRIGEAVLRWAASVAQKPTEYEPGKTYEVGERVFIPPNPVGTAMCGAQWGGGNLIHICTLERGHEGRCSWPD